MAHIPEPPPVQRHVDAPPPAYRRPPGPPPGGPGKWDWWPEHPGKRLMIAATAAWVGLLIPAFTFGKYAAYAGARGGEGTNHYMVGHRLVTQGEMESRAIWNGMECVGWLTVAWVGAVAVGCVMVLALERRAA